MAPRTSKNKIIHHKLGVIKYKVAKMSPDVVNILLNRLDTSRLREQGADLTLLENIGGRRARTVMIRVLGTMK